MLGSRGRRVCGGRRMRSGRRGMSVGWRRLGDCGRRLSVPRTLSEAQHTFVGGLGPRHAPVTAIFQLTPSGGQLDIAIESGRGRGRVGQCGPRGARRGRVWRRVHTRGGSPKTRMLRQGRGSPAVVVERCHPIIVGSGGSLLAVLHRMVVGGGVMVAAHVHWVMPCGRPALQTIAELGWHEGLQVTVKVWWRVLVVVGGLGGIVAQVTRGALLPHHGVLRRRRRPVSGGEHGVLRKGGGHLHHSSRGRRGSPWRVAPCLPLLPPVSPYTRLPGTFPVLLLLSQP